MNPNSINQRWSRWTFTIRPGTKRLSFDVVKAHAARFGRKGFGSASQMKVEIAASGLVTIHVRTEGHPVHDPLFVEWMTAQWRRWAENGWGPTTTLTCKAKLEAGSRQDGSPFDQLIIAPSIPIPELTEAR